MATATAPQTTEDLFTEAHTQVDPIVDGQKASRAHSQATFAADNPLYGKQP